MNILCVRARRSVVASEVWSAVATEASLHRHCFANTVGSVTDKHAETLEAGQSTFVAIGSNTYGFEGCDLALARRDVVHDETTLGLSRILVVEQISVWNLRHALIRSVVCLEVNVRGPVVAQLRYRDQQDFWMSVRYL
jgi:hypothetical protein